MKWADVAFIAVLLGACLIAFHYDGKRKDEAMERYCEMVRLNKVDESRGVSPKNRRGWPDYKSIWYERCMK